ncbi:tubulin domain-containing protein [Cryomyces antarcticus]
MHEIVTLQFGQQSNYLGTHFWNTQESYFTYAGEPESPVDHDIHFRPGIGADGSDTFTPRTVIYDLKGAFGTLKRENALYGVQQEKDAARQGLWGGSTSTISQPSIPQNAYQQHLDSGLEPPPLTTETVRFWSDYNRVFYHPRSLVPLHEYELNSVLLPFERWETGEELFANLDKEHDLLDRDLRPFLEECDQLQALQIVTGADDAWGGFSAKYLERLRDESGKTSIWVWALEDGERRARDKSRLQLLAKARSYHALSTQASVYIPLTNAPKNLSPYLSLDASLPWHTSALQATALETMTLPSRLRPPTRQRQSQRSTLDDLAAVFDNAGTRRIAMLDLRNENQDIAFFPSMASPPRTLGPAPHVFARAASQRGAWQSAAQLAASNAAARDRFATDGPTVQHYQSGLLFPLLDSFPGIFNTHRARQGGGLATRATLSTSTAASGRVCALEAAVRRLVGVEEREALCDGLRGICEEYEEGWSEGSDEDDD